MRFMEYAKDGGPLSRVDAFVLIEIKWLFSIMVLRFSDGTRDAYHTHDFHAISWLLRGQLREFFAGGGMPVYYRPSWRPIWTPRSRFHKVSSAGVSWAITFRGPWVKTWDEWDGLRKETYRLTHGRREV